MNEESRQFGAKDTSSFNKRYRTSIINLTLIYVGILAGILFISSSSLYSAFSSKLSHRFQNFPPPKIIVERFGDMPHEYIPSQDDVRNDLVNLLMIVNGFLLLVGGSLSFRLAQWTLIPLKKSYERERVFLSDASHELRTPISILQADIENNLIDKSLSAKNRNRLMSNLEEVKRMGSLVGDLLVVSRLTEENNKNVVTDQKNDLVKILDQLVERLQNLASKNSVTLYFEKTTNKIIANCNEELITQALTNIIKNAILYNTQEGTVTININSDNENATIKIVDTGIGIPKDEIPKIFDRFYRVDKSRSRKTGGSGLGLSIVKSSIEKLGGEIEMDSIVGKGTTVTMQIPLSRSL